MRFKKEDNTYTETDAEKLEMLSTHFAIVFDNDANIDWCILSEIKQKLGFKIIDTTLQFSEFSFAIKKLTLHRTADDIGIEPNKIKLWTRKIEFFY